MGCSNPHPHCQIWSLSMIPSLPAKELENLKKYTLAEQPTASGAPKGPGTRPCLLCEYVHFEINADHDTGRVVTKNGHWVAVVPWWAVWPFEVLCTCCRLHSAQLLTLGASAPLRSSCAFSGSSYKGREGIVRRNLAGCHETLRQLVFILLRILDGDSPASYPANRSDWRAGCSSERHRRGYCALAPPLQAATTAKCYCEEISGWVRAFVAEVGSGALT